MGTRRNLFSALDLEAGDEIAVSVVSQEGAVSLSIQKEGAQPSTRGRT